MAAYGAVGRLLLALATVTSAAACGSSEYTYVKNADDGLYFKVPRAWGGPLDTEQAPNPLSGDPASQAGKIAREHSWQTAFDAALQPSVANVFATQPAEPTVWVFVRDVGPDERLKLSLDSMRDVVLPVSTAQAAGPGAGFEMLVNAELNPRKGFYGLRTVFNFKLSAGSQTVDQTVLTNDKRTKLYYLVVRCSTECFESRRKQISTVVNSFTVRG